MFAPEEDPQPPPRLRDKLGLHDWQYRFPPDEMEQLRLWLIHVLERGWRPLT